MRVALSLEIVHDFSFCLFFKGEKEREGESKNKQCGYYSRQ